MNTFGRGTVRGTSFRSLLFARHLLKFKKTRRKRETGRGKFFKKKTSYENKQVKNYEEVTFLLIGIGSYYLPEDFWI